MQKPQGKNVWTLLKGKEKDPCEAQAGAELAAFYVFQSAFIGGLLTALHIPVGKAMQTHAHSKTIGCTLVLNVVFSACFTETMG